MIAIQQIEFIGQLKNMDGVDADDAQSWLILSVLEKTRETRLNFLKEVQ